MAIKPIEYESVKLSKKVVKRMRQHKASFGVPFSKLVDMALDKYFESIVTANTLPSKSSSKS
jgi:hypothetical protein